MRRLILLLLPALLFAQAPPPPADPGPKAGDKIPEFSLPDQTGKMQTISSLMGKNGLLLVFTRSADW